MRTTLLLLCSVCFAFAGSWRMFEGRLHNMNPGPILTPIKGEVLTVLSNGVIGQFIVKIETREAPSSLGSSTPGLGGGRIMSLGPGKLIRVEKERGKRFFLANPPREVLAEGRELNFQALAVGTTNMNGSIIESYDFGREPTQDEIAEVMAQLRDAATKQKVEHDAAVERRRNEMAPRVIAYQHQQASNGYPSFQLELGKRYLRGDGVDQNMLLARHWLQSACTNGDSQASNILAKIAEKP
jgi:hypothetical protein